MDELQYRQKCLSQKINACNVCGKAEKLYVHHIDGDRSNSELSNLVPLCPGCHRKVHSPVDHGDSIDQYTSKLPDRSLISVVEAGVEGSGFEGRGEPAYADNTPLVRVFGDGPRVRIIAALLSEADGNDLNVTDLARMGGISRNTVYRHIPDLIDLGVVVETRSVGSSSMYAINKDSEAVKRLAEAEWGFTDEWYGEDAIDENTVQREGEDQ